MGRVALAEVRADPLSVDECVSAISAPGAGGLGVFIGLVRDLDDGQAVSGLRYEAHPSARDHLFAACADAARRTVAGPVIGVAATHRTGLLAIGDIAVVVAVSAEHRAAALDTCRWLIDEIKTTVPIWKQQYFADGSASWLET